jgi:hypothetical protein
MTLSGLILLAQLSIMVGAPLRSRHNEQSPAVLVVELSAQLEQRKALITELWAHIVSADDPVILPWVGPRPQAADAQWRTTPRRQGRASTCSRPPTTRPPALDDTNKPHTSSSKSSRQSLLAMPVLSSVKPGRAFTSTGPTTFLTNPPFLLERNQDS